MGFCFSLNGDKTEEAACCHQKHAESLHGIDGSKVLARVKGVTSIPIQS
jgi:hypothetical protein